MFHLAADSHVDRSIEGPEAFIQTNLVGTYRLLEAARAHQKKMKNGQDFHFLHVSTNEAFGTLGADDPTFTEETPYRPNSPYFASKAGSDHLARAWIILLGYRRSLPTAQIPTGLGSTLRS